MQKLNRLQSCKGKLIGNIRRDTNLLVGVVAGQCRLQTKKIALTHKNRGKLNLPSPKKAQMGSNLIDSEENGDVQHQTDPESRSEDFQERKTSLAWLTC